MNATRCLVALAGVALVIGYFVFEPGRYIGGACSDGLLRLACFEAQRGAVEAWVAAHPWLAAGGFFGVYVAVTALSIPGAAVMTLAGGALFGLAEGTLLVSFASAIGASLAFVIADLNFDGRQGLAHRAQAGADCVVVSGMRIPVVVWPEQGDC